EPIASVPPLTVVPPEYVLAPERVSVPEPDLLTVMRPPPSEITPEKSALPESNETVLAIPPAWIGPDMVNVAKELFVISSELLRTIGAEIVSPALPAATLICALLSMLLM